MIIDLRTEGLDNLMRYEADHIPSVGDTISTLKPDRNTYIVLSVDHLVKPLFLSDERRLELVTVTVRENIFNDDTVEIDIVREHGKG